MCPYARCSFQNAKTILFTEKLLVAYLSIGENYRVWATRRAEIRM
ncbi:hypothetical protein BN903_185 [Halorubrum sp. AJ67]|nr:hypothetical protein BN903_185 [Halorubrum sp. AJ67]